MPTIKLDDRPFAGRTSTPPTNREAGPRECRHCGSQLAGGYQGRPVHRREGQARLDVRLRP